MVPPVGGLKGKPVYLYYKESGAIPVAVIPPLHNGELISTTSTVRPTWLNGKEAGKAGKPEDLPGYVNNIQLSGERHEM